MLAVGWLSGRRGWVMQVLQRSTPADGVEGRGREYLLRLASQGHLPAAEAMAAGGQGQGDGGVGGAAGGDGGVSEGRRASNRVNSAEKTKLLILACTHLNQLHVVP